MDLVIVLFSNNNICSCHFIISERLRLDELVSIDMLLIISEAIRFSISVLGRFGLLLPQLFFTVILIA
jgi:hypothetical protein